MYMCIVQRVCDGMQLTFHMKSVTFGRTYGRTDGILEGQRRIIKGNKGKGELEVEDVLDNFHGDNNSNNNNNNKTCSFFPTRIPQILFPKYRSAHAVDGKRGEAGYDSDEEEDLDPNFDFSAAFILDEDPEAKFLRERMIVDGKCPSESNLHDAVDSEKRSGRGRAERRSARLERSNSMPNKSYSTEGPLPVKNDYDSLISEIDKQKDMIARAAASRLALRQAPILKRPSTASLLNEIPARYPAPPPIVK